MTVRDLAHQQLTRVQALAAGGAVAREEVDQREADAHAADDAVRAADYAVAQAEHDRDVARARLGSPSSPGAQRDWVIVSPVDGVVLARHHESQSIVPAGEPLLDVGDPSRLEIVADLLSTDAVKIRPGSPVLIEQWGGPTTLHGHVRRIEPSGFTKVSALGVEEQRVNVIIDFDAAGDEAPALGDNFRVEVRVVTWRADDVVKMPLGALFRDGDRWAAYVIDGGRARKQVLTLGQRNSEEAQVVDGVAAGAEVVLYPPDTLRDGVRVNVRPPA